MEGQGGSRDEGHPCDRVFAEAQNSGRRRVSVRRRVLVRRRVRVQAFVEVQNSGRCPAWAGTELGLRRRDDEAASRTHLAAGGSCCLTIATPPPLGGRVGGDLRDGHSREIFRGVREMRVGPLCEEGGGRP